MTGHIGDQTGPRAHFLEITSLVKMNAKEEIFNVLTTDGCELCGFENRNILKKRGKSNFKMAQGSVC